MNLEIRPFAAADEDAAYDHFAETWHATYDDISGAERVATSLARMQKDTLGSIYLRSPKMRMLVAAEGRRIVGTITFRDAGAEATIFGLFVRPGFQRAGLGSALLARALAELPAARRIQLHAMTETPAAIAFYRKHGFALEALERLPIDGIERELARMALLREAR